MACYTVVTEVQYCTAGVDTKVSEALARRASTGHVLLALSSWPLAPKI